MGRVRRKADPSVFTTGEAAHICRLSQQTIIRCFDRAVLLGFQVPGSKYRRIPRESLVAFMAAHGIPQDRLPPLDEGGTDEGGVELDRRLAELAGQ
jgi:hypothetical protein